jgi:hypothetical protein
MITPSYSPTATERVLPRMALDFTTGVLDPRVTVTRALNTATRVNSSGFVEGVNANLPRFDYDPATLAPRGLLIEEARTNLTLYSEQFDDVWWQKVAVSVSSNAAIAPSGTLVADKIIPSVANSTHEISPSTPPTVSIGTPYTYTVYAKADGYNFLQIVFSTGATGSGTYRNINLSTGALAAGDHPATVTNAGNGYYRVAVTITPTTTAPIVVFGVQSTDAARRATFAGNGTSGVLFYGTQEEAGAFATSYIPTTTTSLTRNADAVSMTGTNFSSWYNQTQGAIVIGGDVLQAPTGVVQFATLFQDYSNFIRIRCVSSSTPEGNIFSGGSSVMELTSGNISSNTPFKVALAYAANNGNFGLNGTHAITDTSVTLPTPTLLAIGALDAFASGVMSGHIAFIDYYPQRIINPEIAAFSK